jgi:hypothetical protein
LTTIITPSPLVAAFDPLALLHDGDNRAFAFLRRVAGELCPA